MKPHHVVLHHRQHDDFHNATVLQRGEPVLGLVEMQAHVAEVVRIKIAPHFGHTPQFSGKLGDFPGRLRFGQRPEVHRNGRRGCRAGGSSRVPVPPVG